MLRMDRVVISPVPTSLSGGEELVCILSVPNEVHVRGMLQTCLDETGKWKDRHLLFAGWVSDGNRWQLFQEEWFSLLEEFPGVNSIHMSVLMHLSSEKKYQDHVFSEARPRQKLINKCVDLISKYTLGAVACGVDCEAYRRILSKEAQRQTGRDAHVFVFRRTLKHISDVLVEIKWPYPTALIFDDNHEYAVECYGHYSNARKAFEQWKKTFGSITFADDELYPPLQAADVLAWFLRKRHGASYDGRYDRTIKRLLHNKAAETHYYDEQSLIELNEQLTTP